MHGARPACIAQVHAHASGLLPPPPSLHLKEAFNLCVYVLLSPPCTAVRPVLSGIAYRGEPPELTSYEKASAFFIFLNMLLAVAATVFGESTPPVEPPAERGATTLLRFDELNDAHIVHVFCFVIMDELSQPGRVSMLLGTLRA